MTLLDQILLGVYLGLVTGVFTSFLTFSLAFAFKHIAGVSFPNTMGLMIGLGAAGIQGGLFGIIRNADLLRSPVIIVGILIVLLMTLYSHKVGEKLGETVPKGLIRRRLRKTTLAPEVVKQIGRFGQVRIRTSGEVADMEGHHPLPDDLRTAIREETWTFPADLPLPELEARLAQKLRTDYDLEDVTVNIDEKGRATISAAPPSSGLSRRVPSGKQAVPVEAMIPAGLGQGDRVTFEAGDQTVSGTVIGVTPKGVEEETETEAEDEDSEESEPAVVKAPRTAPTSEGGEGRIAVAVDSQDVKTVVSNDVNRFVTEPRGQNREYELVSLLRKDGNGFRKFTVRPESSTVETPLGDLNLREEYGVALLAIKRVDTWLFGPEGETEIHVGDELFVTGTQDDLDRFEKVVV